MFKNIKLTAIALTSTLLVACGGGGGVADSGGGVSTLSFPVQSGYRSLQVNGMSRTFTISGSCTGTGSKTSAAANTAATFEGKAAFSSVSTLLMTVASPCNNIAQTYTTYIDSNYVGLGMNSVGVNYGVYLTAPLIPASVKVGDTGIIGTVTLYTNSTKAVGNGTTTSSYVVTADTTNTALINIIGKIYSATSVLTATEQDIYRIDSLGMLTALSVDILYSDGNHLVLTYN